MAYHPIEALRIADNPSDTTATSIAVLSCRIHFNVFHGYGDLRLVRAPRSVVPADAARFARTVAGRTVTVAVPARSMVLTSSVGARGRRGVAALIPPGWRSIGVPIDDATPTLRVGIRVDLLGVFTRGAIRDGPPSEVLAADVGVVEVNEHRVTVAVPGPSVARVAEGLVNGQVIVVLRS